jgi:hypothetical protein
MQGMPMFRGYTIIAYVKANGYNIKPRREVSPKLA